METSTSLASQPHKGFNSRQKADLYDAYRRKIQNRLRIPCTKRILGDLRHKVIFDFACGAGHDVIAFSESGASRVLGIDISPDMIDKARENALHCPSSVEFRVADCCQEPPVGLRNAADIVYSSYLLCFAKSREQLLAMIKSMYAAAKPNGGRCIGLTRNMNQPPQDYAKNEMYGFKQELVDDGLTRKDGRGTWRVQHVYDEIIKANVHIEFENYSFSREVYEELFREAGFGRVEWLLPLKSDYAESEQAFVRNFVETPYTVWFCAEKI